MHSATQKMHHPSLVVNGVIEFTTLWLGMIVLFYAMGELGRPVTDTLLAYIGVGARMAAALVAAGVLLSGIIVFLWILLKFVTSQLEIIIIGTKLFLLHVATRQQTRLS